MPGLGRRLQRDVAQAMAIPGQFNEQRRGPARSSAEILNRKNQTLFNSSLMRESRALSLVSRLIDSSNIPEGTL
jgi:hypothetical protein